MEKWQHMNSINDVKFRKTLNRTLKHTYIHILSKKKKFCFCLSWNSLDSLMNKTNWKKIYKFEQLTDGFPMQRRIWSGARYDGLYRPGKQPVELIFILSGDGYMDIVMHPPLKSSSSFNALAASNGVGE